jgi:hypothetical protein
MKLNVPNPNRFAIGMGTGSESGKMYVAKYLASPEPGDDGG